MAPSFVGNRSKGFLIFLYALFYALTTVTAQDCSASNHCAVGCCTKWGFCGLGPEYCNSDICVANCDRKSQCDPGGFGSKYAERVKCPLNVCCSKFGFCGLTEEFCGNKKVKKRSCGDGHELQRVVGYYEGWSTQRPCNRFVPEQIPLGVYTHLNFAFATINPVTFEIQSASHKDPEYYKRLTYLKRLDPDLKVFIAIGGWTFNDPGPTATTFSDIARSKANQDAFIKSLISFMATYDFDGVDLDWEYPGAKDRSGRDEDFANFPSFMADLKKALKSTGGRDGISITLPASYWYLQHFDIIKLAPHVDFFNMMTYDLHGTWDQGNKWVGPYLNAHTNLTEIEEGMNLLWRNNINPNKVVLGMAFYGRAFTAVDGNCRQPGCTYASGAPAQKCSKEVSVMLNSEILDVIKETSAKPYLDKKAAVKVLPFGDRHWVAYDDEETFKLKAAFARSQCMSGLMVWAVSHDTKNADFTGALALAAGRKFPSLPNLVRLPVGSDDGLEKVVTKQPQCMWTNCGEECPSNWVRVMRQGPGARKNERMADPTGCGDRGLHYFCCPPDTEAPTCGWYTHNNGKCDPKCPSGFTEVGALQEHCNNGKYQAGCCTVGGSNMKLHEQCKWLNWPDCDAGKCEADEVALSSTGNGGGECRMRNWNDFLSPIELEERKYCCDSSENQKWEDCQWYDSLGDGPADDSVFCRTGCPPDRVRVAMDTFVNDGANGRRCKRGGRSKCCIPRSATVTKRESSKDALYRDTLTEFIKRPVCENTSLKRSLPLLSESHEPKGHARRALQLRASSEDEERVVRFVGLIVTQTATSSQVAIWEQVVATKYPGLKPQLIWSWLKNSAYANDYGWSHFSTLFACNLPHYNQLIQGKGVSCPCKTEVCCPGGGNECSDEGFAEDDSSDTSRRRSDGSESLELLETRDDETGVFNASESAKAVLFAGSRVPPGDPRPYSTSFTTGQVLSFFSLAYQPSNLLSATSPVRNFGLTFTGDGDCVSVEVHYEVVLFGQPGYHMEHILELNTIYRFFGAAESGHFPDMTLDPQYRVPASFFMTLGRNYGIGPPMRGGQLSGVPIVRIMNALGSLDFSDHFVLAQGGLNMLKTKIWKLNEPVGHDIMANYLDRATTDGSFLREIRQIIAVFSYYGDHIVWQNMLGTYWAVREELMRAQNIYNIQNPGATVDVVHVWSLYMKSLFRQQQFLALDFINDWYLRAINLYAHDNSDDVIMFIARLSTLFRYTRDIELPIETMQ